MKRFWEYKGVIYAVYALAALLIAVQKLALTAQLGAKGGVQSPTNYENYVIFKNSFFHLWQGLNLYAAFPEEQWDLFKYSPVFALCMAPFALLPDLLGLPLWNLLNALLPLAALFALPVLSDRQKVFCAWFILPEMIVSVQNSQSNGLTLGMMLWAYVWLENAPASVGKSAKSSFAIAAATFIKVFGIFAAALSILYPQKRAFIAWLLVWTLIMTLAPLVALSPEQLLRAYQWWWELLQGDHEASVGLSVQGWLETWFGLVPSKMAVTGTGLVLFGASVLAVYREASTADRVLAWSSLLVWVVIFNHKAESPTFVIALCGMALWYCYSRQGRWEKVLLWSAFILASVSPTDIFPRALREQVVQPYVLKALPFIVLWVLITVQLLRRYHAPTTEAHARVHH